MTVSSGVVSGEWLVVSVGEGCVIRGEPNVSTKANLYSVERNINESCEETK